VAAAGLFDTVADHVSDQVPVADPGATAGEIRLSLGGTRFETAAAVAVCEGERLVGLIRIEDLLAAPEDAAASQLIDASPPVVAPGTDQEAAAWKAVQHGEGTLAVVDAGARFLGLIPPDRLLAVLSSRSTTRTWRASEASCRTRRRPGPRVKSRF
jgi:magnesium transporter